MTMSSDSDRDAMRTGLLMAAGSLRAAMDDIIVAHLRTDGTAFKTVYGPSGKLRQRIADGERPDAFASASLDHLHALASLHMLEEPSVFARNALCVVANSELHSDAGQFVDRLCDPAVRLATSTPGSDPMGDYTWQLFRNIDSQRAGAFRTLSEKSLKFSGTEVPALGDRSPYIAAFEDDWADAYIMYRTNAMAVKRALPQLCLIPVPDAYNVQCAYGIAAAPHSSIGRRFIGFVLSSVGQELLARHGFENGAGQILSIHSHISEGE
jgi:molybdate transport system substrate-binding protein